MLPGSCQQHVCKKAVPVTAFFCVIFYKKLHHGKFLHTKPLRLVLQITVDQLGGDLPGHFINQMGEGGFRYLIDNGVWNADAHDARANTEHRDYRSHTVKLQFRLV